MLASHPLAAADLADVLAFASAGSCYERPVTWHPGDIAWLFATQGPNAAALRDAQLWRQNGRVVAMAWFYGAGDLRFEILDASVPLLELTGWAETHMRGAAGRLGQALELDAFDTNLARGAAFLAAGFQRANVHTVLMRADLAHAAPPQLPAGYTFEDCRTADIDARVQSQRTGWDDLSQIGLPEARSKFTRATYDAAAAAPNYDPALDLVVRDVSGAYVANAICWADQASGEGTFEPVSVVTAHRGKGIARALVAEGFRRFRERGLTRGRVGTAHFNAPAIAAYQAAGFKIIARGEGWRRA